MIVISFMWKNTLITGVCRRKIANCRAVQKLVRSTIMRSARIEIIILLLAIALVLKFADSH